MIPPNTPPGTRVICINSRETSCAVATIGSALSRAMRRSGSRCWSPSGSMSQFRVRPRCGSGNWSWHDPRPHPAQLADKYGAEIRARSPAG